MCKMKATALLLMAVLLSQPLCAVAQTQTAIKAQLDKIPIGNIVEVKLLRKDSNKIKGKLVSVMDEGFEIQVVKSGTITSEKFAFADVKSVKEKRRMSTGKKILIKVGIGLAAIGALSLISFAMFAAR